MNEKINLIKKVLVIAVPTYVVAFATEAMVYTVPMLAITTLIATSMFQNTSSIRNRVDEEGIDDQGDIADSDSFTEFGE